jgi:hypothetical protein
MADGVGCAKHSDRQVERPGRGAEAPADYAIRALDRALG